MKKYIDRDVGIYHIEYVCANRDTDGHLLYHVKCRYCEYENDMRMSSIKRAKMCNHKTKTGLIIDFKSKWQSSRIRDIFYGMTSRCYDDANKDYCWYGAKGISVCKKWLDDPRTFEEWALNNGYSDNLTIDRIDSGKNYCPDNCQWIPLQENTRKAGKVNWITVEGITLTGKQWAEKLQVGINTINRIVKRCGIDKTIVLISKMLKEPIATKQIKPGQSLLAVYGIQI
jgi:hypothetical protein